MTRKRRLNRAGVIEAARAVLEAKGYEEFSLRAVAAHLEVDPMALYRHVRDKADLKTGVADTLLESLILPDSHLPWSERLKILFDRYRTLALAHPESFEVLFLHAYRTHITLPAQERFDRVITEALQEAGYPDKDVNELQRMFSHLAPGYAHDEVRAWKAYPDVFARVKSPFTDLMEWLIDHMMDSVSGVATGKSVESNLGDSNDALHLEETPASPEDRLRSGI